MTSADMEPVSIANLHVNSSFHSTLDERKSKGDRLVLIRMPAEVKIDHFTGCILSNLENTDSDVLGRVKVMKRKKTSFVKDFSFTKESNEENLANESEASHYVLRRNDADSRMTSVALTVATNLASSYREDAVKMTVSTSRFDEFWTLDSDCSVPQVDYAAIEKRVKKHASRPLVAQPSGLRMRVSTVSTPPARKRNKPQKKHNQDPK